MYNINKQISRSFLQADNSRKLQINIIQDIESIITFSSTTVDNSNLNRNFQTAANKQTSLTSISNDLVTSGIHYLKVEPILYS